MAMIDAVVAYDISDDDARAAAAALLSKHGVRLQRSVFFCQFADTQAQHDVLHALKAEASPATDTVHVFRQCATCATHRQEWGQYRPPLDTPYWIV
jgi:CRISPR-associated endonuclease Cas2